MYQAINQSEFIDAFTNMGRENQFSYNGKIALFEYLEQLEDETGEKFELDVIALCCEYTEYADLAEFQNDYSDEYQSLDDIRDATMVIPVDDDRFIIQQF